MEEVQIVAQRVHDDYQSSQHQLGLAQDRVNELLGIVSNQADQLEHQRKEHTGFDSNGFGFAASSDAA